MKETGEKETRMKETGMKETRMKVPDMSCGHCVATVQRALETLEGVESVDVSLETKVVIVRAIQELEAYDLLETVRETGFTPEVDG